MARPLLSACILCRDEQRVLHRCLGSLAGVVDSIVFVDTGSTDGSIAIAKSYGAEVSSFPWVDDFSAARNETLRRSQARWCLVLDCDEHLEGALTEPGALMKLLLEYEQTHPHAWPVLFGKVQVLDKDLEEHQTYQLTKQLRIFPNDPQIYYESPIHNRLVLAPELYQRKGFTLELSATDLRIIHRGYDPTVQRDKKKGERAFRILARAIVDRPDALNFFYLGREHHHQAEWPPAIEYLTKARDLILGAGNVLEQHHLESVFNLLVTAMHRSGAPLESIRTQLVRALELFPLSADLWHEAGTIFLEREELVSARDALQRAADLIPLAEEREVSFLAHRAWACHLNLARVLGELGDVQAARRSLERAIEAGFPESDALRDLLTSQTVDGFVRAGVASVPARVEHLAVMLGSILPQVDAVTVYLNGYGDDVPTFLDDPKITVVRSEEHGDLRDSGKFWGLAEPFDYYFSVDDDILYPANYVSELVERIEAYDRKKVVGVHGSQLRRDFASYIRDRDVHHCAAALGEDTKVDVLGTGTAAFHKSTLRLTLADFTRHGMTDLWFSKACHDQGIERIAVARRKNWITVLEVTTGTLWEEALHDDRPQTEVARELQADP